MFFPECERKVLKFVQAEVSLIKATPEKEQDYRYYGLKKVLYTNPTMAFPTKLELIQLAIHFPQSDLSIFYYLIPKYFVLYFTSCFKHLN